MQITHQKDTGFFAISEEGKKIGELLYVSIENGKQLRFDHTRVDKDQEGQGIGKALVDFGVDYARQNSLLVVPACPYVAVLFKRSPELYKDIAAPATH
jgi:predicted GNAT family acetyltransferase